MPTVKLSDGADIFYREDDFTDPWTPTETVVLMHGYCRNSRFWYPWVPALARHFRVLRWDARGVGKSTVPPPGSFAWSLERYHQDLREFLDAAGCERAHFVGESMGGMVMPYFASWYPERIASLTAVSSNLAMRGQVGKEMAAGAASMLDALHAASDLRDYIRATEDGRLHPDEVTGAARDWYREEWASTARHIWIEWATQLVSKIDLTPELLSGIEVPMLYIAATGSSRTSLDEARGWTENVPGAKLATVESRSQGIAFAKADECASITRDFLRG